MRIISGINKGRKFIIPSNLPVRPTTDRAKEAIFNILENRYQLENKSILDLCSGTGNISFEFGSRGCKEITAVDKDKYCCRFISNMADKLNYNIDIERKDCLEFIDKTNKQYDIIYADPPYNFRYYHQLQKKISDRNLIRKNGCLIMEHDSNTDFDTENVELRKYGSVHFSIFAY
jgi:16S rRNA (guanine(966)-N(2))-methyltransferase RsmD|tara:strand:+ start:3066 stop:3590 length:525 start_codon:yes stop_codon:yes gene_type:complete